MLPFKVKGGDFFGLAEEHRLLIRVRPLHAVALMPGDQEEIARCERDLPAVVETQGGASLHHQHPLIPLLVLPEARRRCLPPRDDPFDPEGVRPEDLPDNFLRHHPRDVGKQAVDGKHLQSSLVIDRFLP